MSWNWQHWGQQHWRQNAHLMGVSIYLWRASIGHFHTSYKSYYEGKRKLSLQFFTFYALLTAYLQCFNSKYSFCGFYILVIINLILLCGNIKENLGPKTKPNNNLVVGQRNVNSIPFHNFQKIISFVVM